MKAIMKLLGVESTSQQLARQETNLARQKEIIDRLQRKADRLKDLHDDSEREEHKQAIANHIVETKAKLHRYMDDYVETKMIVDIIRITYESSKGIFA